MLAPTHTTNEASLVASKKRLMSHDNHTDHKGETKTEINNRMITGVQ